MKKAAFLIPLSPLLFITSCAKPPIVKTYTITFVNDDGTELQKTEVEEGTLPVYEQETPTHDVEKEDPHEYVYTGWDKEIVKATQDATYKATYDYVFLFGTYPQKLISDEELTKNIDDHGEDVDLGYKLYNDVLYYKWASKQNFVADDGTYVYKDDSYYYEVDPIRWRILGDESTNKFFTTYNLLDTGIYNSRSEFTAEHPNNFSACYMRTWMDQDDENSFYGRAFNLQEKAQIKSDIQVQNGPETTRDFDEGGQSLYTCDPTTDYAFSLSRQELRDPNLGFEDTDKVSKTRMALTTDFARATGAATFFFGSFTNYGLYWTRSPAQNEHCGTVDSYVYNVTLDGAIGHQLCDEIGRCYRPSIRLK